MYILDFGYQSFSEKYNFSEKDLQICAEILADFLSDD